MLDAWKPIVPPNRLALRFMDCLGVGLLALGWLLGLALGLSFGSEGFGLGGLALTWVGLRLPALGLALAWCWVLGVGGVGVWGGWCWGVGCGSGSSPLGAALVFAFCFANPDDD